MKMMIDRARDLFLENPNQTAEEVALILLDEYNEVAARAGVRPSSLYAQSLECACLVLQVREHLEKLAKEKPSRVQERVQELVKMGPDAEGEYVEGVRGLLVGPPPKSDSKTAATWLPKTECWKWRKRGMA